ncbi:MAG: site-2 protease family protein [Planctomycetota bacterium]
MTWERSAPSASNPLAWSLPLFPIAGIHFRVHFTFIAYALIVVLRGSYGPAEESSVHGASTVGMAVGALFLLVFLRESTRALVVRASGGSAADVVLWPLGSLQGIDPAPGWLAALLSAAVGTAVSAVAFAAMGIALGMVTGDWIGAGLPDPISASWLSNPHVWWIDALWITHWTGAQLALLALLPMLPLDGGRAMEAFILRRRGEYETPRIAAVATLATASTAGLVAIVRDFSTLLTVAIACAGFAAFILWRLRAGDSVAAARPSWMAVHDDAEEREVAAERERAERERQALAVEDRAVDAILEKIAREGADRLSAAERATLARATERRRGRSQS